MLPAIHFIFSRAACDDAAREVSSAGITLTSTQERAEIRALADQHTAPLTSDELQTLGFDSFVEQLEAGVAAHHAGMVPVFKELVEAAFVRGLVKMVYATETLALGINMPAKSVVIDKLTKWTGDHHEFLTPAQYTQLTGRAGRRGIDDIGQALVLWSPWVTFDQVAELASSREFVLTSAFRPTYNMTANLVRRYEPERARQLLNLSFAQFRANAGIVRSEHELERLLDRRHEVIRKIEAEFGPLEEIRAAVREVTTRAADDVPTDDVSFALSQLKPGQIIEVDGPGLPPHLAVVSVAFRKGNRVKVVGVDVDSETYELTGRSLDQMPIVIGSFDVPQPYLPTSVTFIYEISQDLGRARLINPKRRRRPDPGSTAAHSRRDGQSIPRPAIKALKRLDRLETDIDRVRTSVVADTGSLARQFDSVLAVLRSRGHVDDWTLTSSGRRLAGTYHEADLLVVESLEEGVFDGLSVPEVAALAAVFGYEDRSRGSRTPTAKGRSKLGKHDPGIVFPTREVRRRYKVVERLHRDLAREERHSNLPETKPPDPGFMNVAYQWALGVDLDPVLTASETTPGDFVRTIKQVTDLLTQIAMLAPVPLTQRAARQAVDALFRDLVTVSQVTSDAESSESGTGDAA
jgi:ATP-dependent RNA helicase HelY